MDFKQFLIKKITLFFMLTTFITVAIYLLGSMFDGDARFGYDVLLSPLIFAGACILPSLVTYSERELTIKELIPRMALEILLIEAVVLGIAFMSPNIDTGNRTMVCVLAGIVLLIYLVVSLLEWLKELAEAKRMNEDLVEFQSRHKG